MTIQEDIKNAIEVMKQGGVILYPTDTVWGIGCDATNAEAVAKVYKIKKRDDSKALICLVDRFQKALVSTSANVSGEPAAANYCDISQEILDAVDYVCHSRRQEHKPHTPSSIIKLAEDGEVTIIRK